MRFTTRLTLLFGVVLAVFVVSTLPVSAALLRGSEASSRVGVYWDQVAALWAGLDPETQKKTEALMAAVTQWKGAAASPSLDRDARYLRFQTAFLMFTAVQALVLFVLVVAGLRVVMAPVRGMTAVVERLKAGDSRARLTERGGAEWQALARLFNTMLDQNQTLSRLQGWQEIATFLSHQIKNPLTAIAFAEQNVRSLVADSLSGPAAENLSIIADQTQRINRLVRRLRDLTSFEAMVRVDQPFSAWMADWVAHHRGDGEDWQLSLGSVGTVSLIPLLWDQALTNLLNNSREAWTGPDNLSIRLEVRSDRGLVIVEWSDGNRLAEGAAVDQIGTARFTTKKEGSGLGVFFVRRIAELHGGSLSVLPSDHGGLRFVLTLEGGSHGTDSRR